MHLSLIHILLIVWLATGLWHGASDNFVLWGLYYFVLLVLEKTLLRRALAHLPGWCAHGYALFFVVLGWMLFYFCLLYTSTSLAKRLF